VPIDGAAPENTGGRAQLIELSENQCESGRGPRSATCFRRVEASGAGGIATPLPNFMGISSSPTVGPNNDHFDR
jgi:hypothetical protein